jgi:NAD dependent epimerase/dehydratase family enzyme
VVRLALGEMADELLLSSARVEPQKLQEAQYTFRHPELTGALRHMLGKA